MVEFDDDLEDEIRRQVKEQVDRTIQIPDGLTEDEAVASVIEQYKKQTGVELRTPTCGPRCAKKWKAAPPPEIGVGEVSDPRRPGHPPGMALDIFYGIRPPGSTVKWPVEEVSDARSSP